MNDKIRLKIQTFFYVFGETRVILLLAVFLGIELHIAWLAVVTAATALYMQSEKLIPNDPETYLEEIAVRHAGTFLKAMWLTAFLKGLYGFILFLLK